MQNHYIMYYGLEIFSRQLNLHIGPDSLLTAETYGSVFYAMLLPRVNSRKMVGSVGDDVPMRQRENVGEIFIDDRYPPLT